MINIDRFSMQDTTKVHNKNPDLKFRLHVFIPETFKRNALRIGLIIAVFGLFISSAVGLLELSVVSGLKFSVNSQAISNASALSSRIMSLDFLILLSTGMLLSLFLPVLNPLKASLLTLVIIILIYACKLFSFTHFNVIPLEYFMLTLLMLYVVNILVSYFVDIHTRQQLVQTLGQYVPLHIVEAINKGHQAVTMDGEARELTVLFCDIQQFTRISEELNPKQLASLLNEYFTALSKVIFQHHGTIDKFIGDSIMAFWGAPLIQPDHAERATLAALDMHREITRLSEQFKKRGWPGPKAGFGINTGLMAVGNMGSVYRMVYTVIGDAVNVAARIESLTRTYHVPVIVSESTMQASPGVLFREIDTVLLKGKRARTRIYQPLCAKEQANTELLKRLEQHNEAMSCYYGQEWDKARRLFNQLRSIDTTDKYYAVMLAKVNEGSNPLDAGDEILLTKDATELEETAEIRPR